MDEVIHLLHDNCGNIYAPNEGRGDIGQNIADHPESDLAGFEDINDFLSQVEKVGEEVVPDEDNPVENKSSALAYILANNSQTENIEELRDLAREAQIPDDYADGFIWLNSFMNDARSAVVTAGWGEPAQETIYQRMSDFGIENNMPEVIGAEIKQNGRGFKVDRYCAGPRKIEAIQETLGLERLDSVRSIATGNSDNNDGPMLREAQLGIGRGGAYDSANIYTEEDHDFWTRGAAIVVADTLMRGGSEQEAIDRAETYLDSAFESGYDPELEDLSLGGEHNALAYDVLDAFEALEYEDSLEEAEL